MTCNGQDESGVPFSLHVLPNGGTGAINGEDGHPTMAFPGNGSLTPIEIIENRAPMVVTERSLRADSGGPARHRGGLGQTMRFRTLGGATANLTLRPDKLFHAAPGLAGGMDGGLGELWLDGKPLPLDPFSLVPGQELTLKLPGGGGLGDPRERSRALLEQDVMRGIVSRESARNDYGATDEELASIP